jgi:hypothetical protein
MHRPRLLCRFAAIVAVVVFVAVVCREIVAQSPRFEDAFATNQLTKVRDGRYYTPFYGYVIGPHAIVRDGIVYCTFQNGVGKPVVMAYDIAEKKWRGPVFASDFGLVGDAHGNPALCIDNEEHLHIFYGCHGKAMRHTRGTKPLDITSWKEQPAPTPKATYPQVMRMADGAICLFYRAGGHMEPWTLRVSRDNCKTWSDGERVIEMRLDPPDRLAAAYCDFFPGANNETVHVFWNHKDDNAARVTDEKPHPWRPLKYKGLHEAVYRYNVYYAKRGKDGVWRNAAGDKLSLPISKAEADAKCMALDTSDEFSFRGTRLGVDAANQPYIKAGVGVADWARVKSRTVVPTQDKYITHVDGKWQVANKLPEDWPSEIVRIIKAPGVAAYGDEGAAGWSIFCKRNPIREGHGATVFLHHEKLGYVTPPDGPAEVE